MTPVAVWGLGRPCRLATASAKQRHGCPEGLQKHNWLARRLRCGRPWRRAASISVSSAAIGVDTTTTGSGGDSHIPQGFSPKIEHLESHTVPHPPHNVATSTQLRLRRQEQQAAAQSLTRRITTCATVAEAEEIYNTYGDQFNAIHFSALFVSLARLASNDEGYNLHQHHHLAARNHRVLPSRHKATPRYAAASGHRALTHGERYTLRRLVREHLLLDVGLRLMSFAPRQLSNMLAALARLDCPPPAFWLAEWLQHFGRKLAVAPAVPPAPSLTPPLALQPARLHPDPDAGLPFPAAVRGGAGAGAGTMTSTAASSSSSVPSSPSSSLSSSSTCTTADLAQAMWALARLRYTGQLAARQRTAALGDPSRSGTAVPTSLPEVKPVALTNSTQAADTRHQGAAHCLSAQDTHPSQARPSSSTGGEARSAPPRETAAIAGAADIVPSPSLVWLDAVAAAFAARAAAASAAEVASYLWAAARLGYHPPEHVMQALLLRCERLMASDGVQAASHGGGGAARGIGGGGGSREFGPRELSGVLWALAALEFKPGAAWLRLAAGQLARMAGCEGVDRRKEEDKEEYDRAHAACAGPGLGGDRWPPVGMRDAMDVEDVGGDSSAAAAAAAGDSDGLALAAQAAAAAEVVAACASVVKEPLLACPTAGRCDRQGADVGQGAWATTDAAAVLAPEEDWWRDFLDVAESLMPVPTATSVRHLSPTQAAAGGGATAAGGGATAAAAVCLLDARQAATCVWALARLHYRPGPAIMHAVMAHVCFTTNATDANSRGRGAAAISLLPYATPQDLSMLSYALGVLRFRPQPRQSLGLLLAMASQLRDASRQDLVVWLAALVRLRLAVPDPWVAAYLRRAVPELEGLAPLALVNWVEALAELRTVGRRPGGFGDGGSSCDVTGGDGAPGVQRPANKVHEGVCKSSVAAAADVWSVGSVRSGGVGLGTGGGNGVETWAVVALPLHRRRRRSAANTRGQHSSRQRRHHERLPDTSTTTTIPWRLRAVPAASTAASPSGGNPQARTATEDTVVRPAAHLLHRDTLRHLVHVTVSRLPYLTLEQQCRLAWATARLHASLGSRWTHALVQHTAEALAQRHRQHQLSQTILSYDGQRGVARALTPDAAGAAAAAAVPPSTAIWLVRLVWAVAVLLRRTPSHRQVHLSVRHRRWAPPPRGPVCRLRPAHPYNDAAVHRRPSAAVPRRWCALLLAALLPQLPSLSNTQLLRLVHSVAQLRAPKPPQRRLAADLGRYCRRRVAATCGGEQEACDLTTAGLLRWTRGWVAEEEWEVEGTVAMRGRDLGEGSGGGSVREGG